jgi:DNA modification methylase
VSEWRIIGGDALAVLRGMPSEAVHCIVTSPPYWGLRDYGVAGQMGLEPSPEEYVGRMVEVFREARRVLRSDGTLWLNLGDSYATGAGKVGNCPGGGLQGLRWMGDVDRIRDKKRGYRGNRNGHEGKHGYMGSESGMGPMNQPNRMPIAGLKPKDLVGIPWRVAFALQADGWYLRSDIIWAKPNPMPESIKDRPTKAHEYIFLLSKSARYFYDAEAINEPQKEDERTRRLIERERGIATRYTLRRDIPHGQPVPGKNGCARSVEARQALALKGTRNRRTVWEIASCPFPEAHFATFPPKLIEPCILAGCPVGGTVLDPFCGAATTGVVARRLGRDFVGVELNPTYVAMGERRISEDERGRAR